jgi:hypothetical protein
MKKKSYYERFMEMTDAEREAEVAQFDREFVPTKPLTAADRALHRRAARRAGRPRIGKGAERFTITLERELARKADALAKRQHLSRSELIAHGLRNLLNAG